MSTNLLQKRTSPGLVILLVPPLATLLGGLAALAGGVIGMVVSVATVTGLVVGFLFSAPSPKKSDLPVPPSPLPEKAPPKAPEAPKEIPPDRIDALTGLANMNGLNAWFAEKTARLAADNKAIIIMAADLANYAQLVRSRGQEQADAILKEAAKRVSTFTGEDGIAARTGSDEFAVVASVVPQKSAELISDQAGKLTEMLQRPIELPTGVVWIGGSVGAAMGKPTEGPEVLEKAREALKKAKKLGEGHYFVDGITDKE